jgi:undecaprenyl-diphosphatase
MTFFEEIIIAIVEGLTEFLPISSTGHMILASAALGLKSSEFLNLYIISIQFGAILSVVVLYWKRFFQNLKFYYLLIAAVIPTVIIAFALKKYVDHALGNVMVVGINLLLGGCIMIFLENYFSQRKSKESEISYKKAIWIGIVQAATIYGGMSQGLSRKDAAEFSFFLAVPIMFLASAKDAYDFFKETQIPISSHEIQIVVVGNIIAFAVAGVTIKFLVNFVSKNGFKPFAYYRIVMGIVVLILYKYFNFSLQML